MCNEGNCVVDAQNLSSKFKNRMLLCVNACKTTVQVYIRENLLKIEDRIQIPIADCKGQSESGVTFTGS